MEELVYDLLRAGIAVDLLCGAGADGMVHYGVRLRPFAKDLPKGKMIIAEGDSFSEGLDAAYAIAQARTWRNIDWAARPWAAPDKRPSPLSLFV